MKIGFVGIGKLGFPCAVAAASQGHEVLMYDANRAWSDELNCGGVRLYEPGLQELFDENRGKLRFCDDVQAVVEGAEIIFIAVQTPHPPELDGSTPHNGARKDFDYSYLVSSCAEVADAMNRVEDGTYRVVSVISTVLPGTMRRLVFPAFEARIARAIGTTWGLCYNPFFIAMGTTVEDYLHPEFTLIGQSLDVGDSDRAGHALAAFYEGMQTSPKLRMTWDEAEMVKMGYNTFIGMKIVFANTIMQLCEATPGADCSVVMGTLKQATDRLISGRYLSPGMGDGGGCHPRDNLALAYRSDELGLDYNLFAFIMEVRERQASWLAVMVDRYMGDDEEGDPVIMGVTYKPGTDLVAGSPSLLVGHYLEKLNYIPIYHDPETHPDKPEDSSVYLIGTKWPEFKSFPYPSGSTVIDPWGFLSKVDVPSDVELVRVGRHNP